jgi:hypothetical protein
MTKNDMGLIGGVIAGIIVILAAVAIALYIAGASTTPLFGIGAPMIVLAAVITLIVVSLIAFLIASRCEDGSYTSFEHDDWGFKHTTYTPNFNTGAYQTVATKVQQDQQNEQTIQNQIQQDIQEYVTPDQDGKTQDANMIAGALNWMKSLVWTQGAA